ncbi:MAG: Flp pilus assembly protein CpaB [Nitrospiraceae bacterium]
MSRNRMLIAVALAAVVGLIASNFVYRQIKRATAGVKPVAITQIVVAARPLSLGTRLESNQLLQISWPAGDPLPGMFTKIEDCVGRALITSVVENEPILAGKLAPKEAGAGLSVTIPEGMRGLSIKVNQVVGVAGFVLPGTMVDVLVTGRPRGGRSGSITRTFLENVRVLAAGQKVEQDKEGKPRIVPVVTLLVTPAEANKLTMASTEGRIQLALRNTIDTKKTNPPPAYQASLFSGRARRRSPGPQPRSSTYTVEIIRGIKRQIDAFPDEHGNPR